MRPQIQPDAIALDPEFIGGLATQPRVEVDTPFARLPRLARLEAGGKADTTEVHSDSEADMDDEGIDGDGGGAGKKLTKEERAKRKEEKEKKRMRGRNKATKRFLRKQRKNVIDPKAVRPFPDLLFSGMVLIDVLVGRNPREACKGARGETKGPG